MAIVVLSFAATLRTSWMTLCLRLRVDPHTDTKLLKLGRRGFPIEGYDRLMKNIIMRFDHEISVRVRATNTIPFSH